MDVTSVALISVLTSEYLRNHVGIKNFECIGEMVCRLVIGLTLHQEFESRLKSSY